MSYKFKHITGHVHVIEKWNHRGYDDEYTGGGKFQFPLQGIAHFTEINSGTLYFTHILYEVAEWYGGIYYYNPKTKKKLEIIPAPTLLIRDIYEALVVAENGNGQLHNWCFSDELSDAAYPKEKDNGRL